MQAVPEEVDPDHPREWLVVLTVEHMDGLRVDRVAMRVLGPEGTDGAGGFEPADAPATREGGR